jgi:hypothetical protein
MCGIEIVYFGSLVPTPYRTDLSKSFYMCLQLCFQVPSVTFGAIRILIRSTQLLLA